MDAKLERKTMNFYKNLFNSCTTHEETMEMIVPDAMPDIQRVVDCDGVVVLRSKDAEAGKASVGGIINATVLYMPEGECGPIKLELKMPFVSVCENQMIDSNTKLTACVSICSIDCRMLNPRKILVRADILTRLSGYGPASIEFCKPAQEKMADIEILEEKNRLKTITDVREKTFVISDEYALPSSMPLVGEMLKANCKIAVEDTKTVGSKLIIKGTAGVALIYTSKGDGEPVSENFSTLFSQIVEMDAAEEPEFAVTIMPTGIFFDMTDGPNGSTLISMELHAVAQVVVMENKSLEYISDAYSILHELTGVTDNHSIDTVSNYTMRENLRTMVETPVQAKNIVAVNAFTGKTTKSDSDMGCRFETPVTINVIYKSDDGRLLSAAHRMAVASPWEDACENVAYVTSASCGDVGATPTAGGIDIRMNVDLTITATIPQWVKTMANLSYDESKMKDLSAMPSVTMKRVNMGENLWALAKRYSSTRDLIKEANALEDEPEAGIIILIPKRR